jgi:hypothetical protein
MRGDGTHKVSLTRCGTMRQTKYLHELIMETSQVIWRVRNAGADSDHDSRSIMVTDNETE